MSLRRIDGRLFREISGTLIPVDEENAAEAEKQASSTSHQGFFSAKLETDPRQVKQMLRRKEALEKMVQETLTQAAPPNLKSKTVSDETVGQLMATPRAEREGIVLLPEYLHLIMPEGKKPLRHPYPGEIGYYEHDGATVYLFLEEGLEKGHIVTGFSKEEPAQEKKE